MTYLLRLFLLLACTTVLVAPGQILAHDLLPQPLLEYLEAHPEASAAEIERFIAEHPEAANGTTQAAAASQSEQGTLLQTVQNFWQLGLGHVLSGLDHVLFVILVILSATTLRRLLIYVTAFTLAHSITLIGSAFNLLTLSPRVTEPVIALTIVYLAALLLLPSEHRLKQRLPHGTAVIFIFGLFHGLGFAEVLHDVGLGGWTFAAALLSFNIGVECAQLLLIMAAAPFVYLLRPAPRYRFLELLVAGACGGLAVVWAIERIFGLVLM